MFMRLADDFIQSHSQGNRVADVCFILDYLQQTLKYLSFPPSNRNNVIGF